MKKIILKYKNIPSERKIFFKTLCSFLFSFIWSIVKLIMGIFISSLFLLASSLFTLSMCFSKLFCLLGIKKDKDCSSKFYISLSSFLIIIAGIFYGIYNLRLLNGYIPVNYGLIISIVIALFSFIFLINSIVYLIKERKKNNFYYKNLRTIAFINALNDLLLTQMTLLMNKMPNMDHSKNIYFALIISIISILLGIILLNKRKNLDR